MAEKNRTGFWIIGAWGGVATTAVVGLLNLQKQLVRPIGLTTELPDFANVKGMPAWTDFVPGGYEIRDFSFGQAADELTEQRALESSTAAQVRAELEELDARVLPGFLANSGKVVEAMADRKREETLTPREMLFAMQADMKAFAEENQLEHLIVVNLMSTEPVCEYFEKQTLAKLPEAEQAKRRNEWENWDAFRALLDASAESPVPASTLYAAAAMELGYDFVNFTPSLGATPPAFEQLAERTASRFYGNDGKTGETLMKSVLAPMFAHRNLHVMSWVGHNIFGNRDGIVLDDPHNKATKVSSKNHLLEQILGYPPQTLVTIEYIKSLGDWKTAWDHIHFQGFLGTPMTLQFTWQGCDSLLAAPLVLDLLRLTELARRRNFTGRMDFLACFFKSPIRVEEQSFVRQFEELEDWLREE
ncbi:MAG: inositol-3-phosphate synthase [Thermoguttaceae bacterium]|nr:inositol-3-phosphate synthase [Thermoguttaceae bacterium]